MTFRYDKDADALYIKLSDGEQIARTEQVDPGTLVDLDANGRVVGIDLIRPARAWPLDEVAERFEIADDDVAVLHALWREDAAYPFADAASDLVPA